MTVATVFVTTFAARKPAPANIEPHPGPDVRGVPYYRITRRDLRIRAEDRDGNRLAPTVTRIADGLETDGSPLLRYVTLLCEGARAHGLPEPWVRLLDRLESAG